MSRSDKENIHLSVFSFSLEEDSELDINSINNKSQDSNIYSDKCIESENDFCIVEIEDKIITNSEDLLKPIELLENIPPDNYSIKVDDLQSFNSLEYDESIELSDMNIINGLIFKIPSRVFVQNEKSFSIRLRLMKSKKYQFENILVKFISNTFTFSQSMINVNDNDSQIRLTKRSKATDYQLRFKVYINNELAASKNLDLYSREIWD